MRNGHDWAELERDLAALLPGDGQPGDRPLLLQRLRAYARAAVAEARQCGPASITDHEYAHAFEWLGRPVFVCGHHRSGTTLLQHLLDGHPQLLVLPSEGTWFTSFGYATRHGVCPADVDRFIAEWISRFVGPNHAPHFKLGRSCDGLCPPVRFAQRLLGWHAALLRRERSLHRFALLLALVAAFRDLTAPGSQPLRWVEKTPRNERFVDRLDAFPGARFVHVVREPGATLASMLAVDPSTRGKRARTSAHARHIAESLRLARQNARQRPATYLVVRYEDLTGDARAAMERVREFLGIGSSPALLAPSELGQDVAGNSSFGVPAARAGEIYAGRAGPLDIEAQQLLSAFAAAAARPFGYDLEPLGLWRRIVLRVQGAAARCRERDRPTRAQSRSNSAR